MFHPYFTPVYRALIKAGYSDYVAVHYIDCIREPGLQSFYDSFVTNSETRFAEAVTYLGRIESSAEQSERESESEHAPDHDDEHIINAFSAGYQLGERHSDDRHRSLNTALHGSR